MCFGNKYANLLLSAKQSKEKKSSSFLEEGEILKIWWKAFQEHINIMAPEGAFLVMEGSIDYVC